MRQEVFRSPFDHLIVRLVHAQEWPAVGSVVRTLLLVLGVEVPRGVQLGPDLALVHPTTGLVIHPATVIGARVTIFHNVTIGRAEPWEAGKAPGNRVVLEDDVVIGAGAVVLFTPGP